MSGNKIGTIFTLSAEEIIRFRSNLLAWGKTHIRSYPWRYLDDPYKVIVSEFMLHRTQARQVLPIFEHFIDQYPALAAYAKADRNEVEEILRPLGLSWRIQGMLNALDELWRKHGDVPADYELLLSIPTVGPYIAGATVAFTTNRPYTLIDSNIVRVVGRVFGLDLSGEARRKKAVVQAITKVMDPYRPRDFCYAIIDLAHMICRPKKPACPNCPLQNTPCNYGKDFLIDFDI